ncbi:B-box zinc finger domain-containing protein, partial [Toxoplasma gondii FOU]
TPLRATRILRPAGATGDSSSSSVSSGTRVVRCVDPQTHQIHWVKAAPGRPPRKKEATVSTSPATQEETPVSPRTIQIMLEQIGARRIG